MATPSRSSAPLSQTDASPKEKSFIVDKRGGEKEQGETKRRLIDLRGCSSLWMVDELLEVPIFVFSFFCQLFFSHKNTPHYRMTDIYC